MFIINDPSHKLRIYLNIFFIIRVMNLLYSAIKYVGYSLVT